MAEAFPEDADAVPPKNRLVCSFCGGARCKRCGATAYLAQRGTNAVPGLHSSWIGHGETVEQADARQRVTESRSGEPDGAFAPAEPWRRPWSYIAAQRPSSRALRDFHLISWFRSQTPPVTAIVNLQEPGEHPWCGDGVSGETGFAYDPAEVSDAGLSYYAHPFPDMTAPPTELAFEVVKHLHSHVVERGERVLVHCHAGLGRTGLLIACSLMFSFGLSASESIVEVRRDRPGSIQTRMQEAFLVRFGESVGALRGGLWRMVRGGEGDTASLANDLARAIVTAIAVAKDAGIAHSVLRCVRDAVTLYFGPPTTSDALRVRSRVTQAARASDDGHWEAGAISASILSVAGLSDAEECERAVGVRVLLLLLVLRAKPLTREDGGEWRWIETVPTTLIRAVSAARMALESVRDEDGSVARDATFLSASLAKAVAPVAKARAARKFLSSVAADLPDWWLVVRETTAAMRPSKAAPASSTDETAFADRFERQLEAVADMPGEALPTEAAWDAVLAAVSCGGANV
jgi:hypothetical protein